MKRIITLCSLFICLMAFGQEGMVTFSVDMNNYAGSQTLSEGNVYVNGVYNGWCGDCNPLTDENGDGIYEGTYLVAAGVNEYKYTVNGWDEEEGLLPELTCVVTVGENTNRVMIVAGDASLPTACWNDCADCSGGNAAQAGNVTFSVDLSDYNGAEIITSESVFLSGPFNEWSGDANMMTDNGDMVFSTTINLPAGATDYKFTINNWADQEMFDGFGTCTQAFGEFVNRLIIVDGDATLSTTCFDSCFECGAEVAQPGNISLSVNMTEYSGAEILAADNVYVSGAFNEWCGTCNPLDDSDGDGIYEGIVPFPGGMQQFKFTVNDWADQEEFAGGEACTFTDGEFTNRLIAVDGDATMDAVCFASCANCGETGINDVDLGLQLYPNPASSFINVELNEIIESIEIQNLAGQTVLQVENLSTKKHQLDLSELQSGIYFVNVKSNDQINSTRILRN